MIRFLSGKLKKHMKLAKIVKISEIFNRLVFPLNFNQFCHPMTPPFAWSMGSGCDWIRRPKQMDAAAVATACCNLVKIVGPAGM